MSISGVRRRPVVGDSRGAQSVSFPGTTSPWVSVETGRPWEIGRAILGWVVIDFDEDAYHLIFFVTPDLGLAAGHN